MCAASPSRCRKDASSPVRRSPFVAISGPFLSLAVPVAVDYVAVYADHLLLPWHEAVVEQLPGIELFDAHTHTGFNDPDGFSCSAEQLIEGLEIANARAVVFTMQEPDGYSAANDRVIEEASASDGRLVPFCRLDPADDPLAEAQRALGRGACGIKLHPRAEQFRLADDRLEGRDGPAD